MRPSLVVKKGVSSQNYVYTKTNKPTASIPSPLKTIINKTVLNGFVVGVGYF